MPSASPQTPEKNPQKPTLTESVESFIARKKTEKGAEGAKEVQASAEGVQHEVAEVMAGMEKPKEDISERQEKKSEPKPSGEGQAATGAGAVVQGEDDWTTAVFPDEEVMVKKVRTAITLQIKVEWQKAKRLKGKLTQGGAQEYGTAIARIRRLKKMLAGLFSATLDYLKNLYKKYFRPDGSRRSAEEVEVD